MRGSGLFVLAPSGQVTIGVVVQSPPEASYRAKVPKSTFQPTPGSVSLGLSLNPFASPPAGQPHPPRPGSPAF